MQYSLSYRLGGFVKSLDADAAAIVAAVTSAGGTVTGAQTAAIDTFVRTGKGEGWYSLLRRFYLPIWGAAGPNAVDWITRGSGSFEGGVTHGAGFVQGNGTTGYFNPSSPLNGLSGVSTGSFWSGVIKLTGIGNDQYLVANQSATQLFSQRQVVNSVLVFELANATGGDGRLSVNPSSGVLGIVSCRRQGGVRAIMRRSSTGRAVEGSLTNADFGTLPTITPFFMARNNNGTADNFSSAEFSAMWLGIGATDTQDSNFTAALQTLWQTTTGLTLP